METVRVTQRTGKDGVLHVRFPLGRPDEDFDVVVIVQAKSTEVPDERGWPPGYFDLAGSIDDETFVRPPQGELPIKSNIN
jgi:hypothetical protein